MDVKEAKSLRWLAFNFPYTDQPKNTTDRMCNCIHKYCTVAADRLEQLQMERDAAVNELNGLCWCCTHGEPASIGNGGFTACKYLKERGILGATGRQKCERWEWRGSKEG